MRTRKHSIMADDPKKNGVRHPKDFRSFERRERELPFPFTSRNAMFFHHLATLPSPRSLPGVCRCRPGQLTTATGHAVQQYCGQKLARVITRPGQSPVSSSAQANLRMSSRAMPSKKYKAGKWALGDFQFGNCTGSQAAKE